MSRDGGNWLSDTIFDEDEYETPEELVVAIYIMLKRDMAGVCPANARRMASGCRITKAKLTKILDKFEARGKLIMAPDRSHVWWKSGINHSLYKGKYSEKQLKAVVKRLKSWSFSGVFGQNWLETVTQLYTSKYSLVIPITRPSVSESETESETEDELVNGNSDQPNPALQEDKENQDGTESVGTALEQFWAWGAIPANREAVHKLCGMIHYDQIAGDHNNHKQFLLDHVVKGEFGAHLIAKSDAALESLKINHDGSWLRMLKSWLDRILRDIRSGKRKRPTALTGGMSYEDEKAHYAKKRRTGGGMQKINQVGGGE